MNKFDVALFSFISGALVVFAVGSADALMPGMAINSRNNIMNVNNVVAHIFKPNAAAAAALAPLAPMTPTSTVAPPSSCQTSIKSPPNLCIDNPPIAERFLLANVTSCKWTLIRAWWVPIDNVLRADELLGIFLEMRVGPDSNNARSVSQSQSFVEVPELKGIVKSGSNVWMEISKNVEVPAPAKICYETISSDVVAPEMECPKPEIAFQANNQGTAFFCIIKIEPEWNNVTFFYNQPTNIEIHVAENRPAFYYTGDFDQPVFQVGGICKTYSILSIGELKFVVVRVLATGLIRFSWLPDAPCPPQ